MTYAATFAVTDWGPSWDLEPSISLLLACESHTTVGMNNRHTAIGSFPTFPCLFSLCGDPYVWYIQPRVATPSEPLNYLGRFHAPIELGSRRARLTTTQAPIGTASLSSVDSPRAGLGLSLKEGTRYFGYPITRTWGHINALIGYSCARLGPLVASEEQALTNMLHLQPISPIPYVFLSDHCIGLKQFPRVESHHVAALAHRAPGASTPSFTRIPRSSLWSEREIREKQNKYAPNNA
ncbi:hypothetical protein B0T24DRAFT_161779 [Lasiosphaeria ovina]|uniref:Uncharacterized protein n=1 Tax=Lasiosphaeria ovina TaxID=92902 RepID=A0AAE0KNQ3_9PEZI|nr:hypothetical protein B0T24DRAFT_161779 [Lasiosphaeria ovina]